MTDFEIIAAVLHNRFRANRFTVAAIWSSLELIDGEMVSFYATFPWGKEGNGKIVIVTPRSIIESTIELPSEWDIYDHKLDVSSPIIHSKRVPIESVARVNIDSSLQYWEAELPVRHLVGVSVSVTTSNNEIIEVITSSKPPSDNPKQNLAEVLRVLKK